MIGKIIRILKSAGAAVALALLAGPALAEGPLQDPDGDDFVFLVRTCPAGSAGAASCAKYDRFDDPRRQTAGWTNKGAATFVFQNGAYAYFLTAAHVISNSAEPIDRKDVDFCSGASPPEAGADIQLTQKMRDDDHNRDIYRYLYGREVARRYNRFGEDVSLIEVALDQPPNRAASAYVKKALIGADILFRNDLGGGVEKNLSFYGYNAQTFGAGEDLTATEDRAFDEVDSVTVRATTGAGREGVSEYISVQFKNPEVAARAAAVPGNSGAALQIFTSGGGDGRFGARIGGNTLARRYIAGVLKGAQQPANSEYHQGFCKAIDPRADVTQCKYLVFTSAANRQNAWPVLLSMRPSAEICGYAKKAREGGLTAGEASDLSYFSALERMQFYWSIITKSNLSNAAALLSFETAKRERQWANNPASRRHLQLAENFLYNGKTVEAVKCWGVYLALGFWKIQSGLAAYLDNAHSIDPEFRRRVCGETDGGAKSLADAGRSVLSAAEVYASVGELSVDEARIVRRHTERLLAAADAAYKGADLDDPELKAAIASGRAVAIAKFDPDFGRDPVRVARAEAFAEEALKSDADHPAAREVKADILESRGEVEAAEIERERAREVARERLADATKNGDPEDIRRAEFDGWAADASFEFESEKGLD
jgi:hypothetical protein